MPSERAAFLLGQRVAGLRWRPLPQAEAPTELRVSSGHLAKRSNDRAGRRDPGAENGRREGSAHSALTEGASAQRNPNRRAGGRAPSWLLRSRLFFYDPLKSGILFSVFLKLSVLLYIQTSERRLACAAIICGIRPRAFRFFVLRHVAYRGCAIFGQKSDKLKHDL